MNRDLDNRIDQVAALGEPARRALYRHVAAQPEPVGREQAAEALGLPLHVVKFHLDRLVTDGLLAAEYRRPPGRGGPGAGRPAKVYAATGEIEVSMPPRRYDLAGQLLVRAVAVADRTGAPVAPTLHEVARAAGRELGRGAAGRGAGRPAKVRQLTSVLESCGFEPVAARRTIALRNCPFHRLAEEERELVCGMNLAFVRGLLDGVGVPDASAALDPRPGECCVRIETG